MFMAEVPAKLWLVAAIAVVSLAALTLMLGGHALRRLFGVPRMPRPAVMYVVLSALWVGLAASASATLGAIVLMRDHQRVAARTALADVRCQTVGPEQLHMEIRTSPAAAPESYALRGGACVVSIKQVQLRPVFDLLGVHDLSRVDKVVGSGESFVRHSANPSWLTPQPSGGRRVTDLVVRQTRAVDVVVPPEDGPGSVLVASPAGPSLERRRVVSSAQAANTETLR
jgi:hypothetical protein